MAMDIPDQLRAACAAVRRKDFPLADLIPTMQLAADVIDTLREQLLEAADERRVFHEEMDRMRDVVAGIVHGTNAWTRKAAAQAAAQGAAK